MKNIINTLSFVKKQIIRIKQRGIIDKIFQTKTAVSIKNSSFNRTKIADDKTQDKRYK